MPDSKPEILTPRASGRVLGTPLTDEHLDYIASILDDFIPLPGTSFRIGLAAIIGMVPVFGDMLSAIASFVIVFAAWRRGLPKVTLFRMVVNIAIDTLIGIIPVFGDVFDAAWKSNRKNYRLYMRHRESRSVSRRQWWWDWTFLLILAAIMGLVIIAPFLALIWFVESMRNHGYRI